MLRLQHLCHGLCNPGQRGHTDDSVAAVMVNYGPTVDIRAPGTDDNGPRKKEGPIVDARPLNLAGRGDLCNVRPDLELIFNDGELLARFRFQVGGKLAEHDALYAGGNSGIYPDLFRWRVLGLE